MVKGNNMSLAELIEMQWKVKVLFGILVVANIASIAQTIYAWTTLKHVYLESLLPLFILPLALAVANVYLYKTQRD